MNRSPLRLLLLFAFVCGVIVPARAETEFGSFDDIAVAYLEARDKYAPLFPPLLPLPVETLMKMSLEGDFSFTEDPAWFHVRPDGPFPFRARSRDFRGFVKDTLLLVFEDIASGRVIILNEWAKPMAVYKAPPWPLLPGLEAERGHRAWELEFMRRRLSWWVFLDNTPPEPEPPPMMMMMGQGEPDPDEIRFTAISDVNAQPLEMTLRLEYGSNRVGEAWAVFSADWMPTGGWPEGPPGPWQRASEPWTLAAGTNEWVWTDEGQLDRELFTNVLLRVYAAGSLADFDGDGLADGDEWFIYGTDPFNADTDGDWFSDGYEVAAGTDPTLPGSFPGHPSVVIGDGGAFLTNPVTTLSFPGLVADFLSVGFNGFDQTTNDFASVLPFEFPDEDGTHAVFCRLLRADGGSSIWFGSTVTLDRQPPELFITNLHPDAVTSARWIDLSGTVTDAVTYARVTINGDYVHVANHERFSHGGLMLAPGTNEFVVTATDLAGNSAVVTQRVIQDVSGLFTAPDVWLALPHDQEVIGGQTQIVERTTLGAGETLYYSGHVNDETADVEVRLVSGDETLRVSRPVLLGTNFHGRIDLDIGTNMLRALARNAADLVGTNDYEVVRDTGFVLEITNPAPYAVVGQPEVEVSGRASLMFSNALIEVNGEGTALTIEGDWVRFATTNAVPLQAGLTQLEGFAELDGKRYYFDPAVADYEVRVKRESRITVGRVGYRILNTAWRVQSLERTSMVWRAATAEQVSNHYSWNWYETNGVFAFVSIQDPPPATFSTTAPFTNLVRFGRDNTQTGNEAQDNWGTTASRYDGLYRFVKRGPEAKRELVLLKLLNFGDYQPHNITLWGQPGFSHEGHAAFLVPIDIGREYEITPSSFDIPVVQGIWGRYKAYAAQVHFTGVSNTAVQVEIKAEDGSGEPVAFLSPGSTTNFTAIVTADVPGAFVWSVNDEERLQLASTTGSIVTVTVPADAEASAAIGAETLTVTFTPTGQVESVEATHALTVIIVDIVEPAPNHNHAYLSQADYNETGPISFRARVLPTGFNYTGNIDWALALEYETDGSGGPLAHNVSTRSGNDQAFNLNYASKGGRLIITASVDINGVCCSTTITNFITGVGTPNATITQRLNALYTPPAGGTAGLLTGIAMKESTYRQFFNSFTKYDLSARWPIENLSSTPPQGSFIGMMQVPVAMNTAWDWLVNTQTGADIFAEKLNIAGNQVSNHQATKPGLPSLTGVQMENYALGLCGGFSDRYYTPVQNGGQWQWQTTTRQDLLDYVDFIRTNIQ